MKYRALCILIVLCCGVFFCGCINPAPQPATPTPTPVLATTVIPATTTPAYPAQLGGYWVLQTMAIQNGSVPLVPTTEISLTLNPDGSATGYTGCNNYFTTYTLTGQSTPKGDSMVFGPISTSKKYCLETSSQETTYLNNLQNTGAYVVNGDLLTLTGTSQNALVYKRGSTITKTPYYPQPA